MRRLIYLFALIAFAGCNDEMKPEGCSTPATIRDLTGFDGCRWVLELEDGTKLEPVVRLYGCFSSYYANGDVVPEIQSLDALANFEIVDGKKVMIDYEVVSGPSICMVGQTVTVTCIEEIPLPTQD
ncbi:MAG TPA: hypothetical protein VD927_06965 [Chryseosolibacter sp.]|nr:hypothetical protein [Chryseosolibacter sp.]